MIAPLRMQLTLLLTILLLAPWATPVLADDPWVRTGTDGPGSEIIR